MIDGANNRIRLSLPGSPPVRARVVAQDDTNDLALLDTAQKPTAVPTFRGGVRIGEDIAVYGFPMPDVFGAMGNLTDGIVNATAVRYQNTDFLQFLQYSARTLEGNSGGPVLDHDGNVVGIVSQGIDAMLFYETYDDFPTDLNYAIKGDVALNFLKQNGINPKITANKSSLRPWSDAADCAKAFTVFIECNVPEDEMPAEKVSKPGFWGRLLAG